ncbi:MAG: S41 family peptidase [Alistipes sp.]|nr:S41 family peptidase [Alistipes sp.]
MRNNWYKLLFGVCAVVILVSTAAAELWSTNKDQDLGRNMEIMLNVMREVSTNYVDEVASDKLLQDGANGMLSKLDPYTAFIPETELEEFEILSTGKYGGIGATIRMRRDSSVVVAQPYKGTPSDKAGMKIGDKFLSIDGEDVTKLSISEISSRLKGTPGTDVKVAVQSVMDGQRKEYNLTRARIAIPGVPYSGYVTEGVGYIVHNDFTEGCYEEMKAAIEKLQSEGELKSLILDYRNNGGGSLAEAVDVLSLFLPVGTEVVTMKGRTAQSTRVFKTKHAPVAEKIPLVVLINENSASASEIVSGALQDLDRAVVVGQRSYGKGLVQTVIPIGYNSTLKLTTAKYYIPSGRCVQRLNYSAHDGRTAENVPDSLIREFKTANGRKVYDGKGIMPDVKQETEYISTFAVVLYNLGYIEDFLDEYVRRNPDLEVNVREFSITDQDYEDFIAYMADKEVPYESRTRLALEVLQQTAKEERHDDDLEAELKLLGEKLKDAKEDNLRTYRAEIEDLINHDVVLRFKYYEGVLEHAAASDKEVASAIELLKDTERYQTILREQDTERN